MSTQASGKKKYAAESAVAPAARKSKSLPGAITERNARLIALLKSFEESNAEQQRQDLAALKIGIEEARPGQRRIFGEGFNPCDVGRHELHGPVTP